MMANGIGIVDTDYSGDKDEYKIPTLNFTHEPVTIERGTRVAQMTVLNYQKVEWEEVESLKKENRGGFGSTGIR